MDKKLVAKELLKIANGLIAKKIGKEESKKMLKDVEKHIADARDILHEMQDNMEDDKDNNTIREIRTKLFDAAVKIDHL